MSVQYVVNIAPQVRAAPSLETLVVMAERLLVDDRALPQLCGEQLHTLSLHLRPRTLTLAALQTIVEHSPRLTLLTLGADALSREEQDQLGQYCRAHNLDLVVEYEDSHSH